MKQTTKNILGVGAIVLLSSGVAGLTTYKLLQSNEAATETSFNEMFKQNPNVKLAAFDAVNAQPVDLTQAAENSLHAVVHIRSTQEAKTRTVQQAPDIFDFFFGDGRGQQRQVQTQPRVGFGSGVIISKDGYIVTNNHVIDGADEISVKLNDNREFKGRVIGTDPSTDLALVKIEGDDFPTIPVGDSEALKVGEWVLAVGNPFNLNSTVTAGIVSAKARSLGVYNNGIESFIQTDAAINQGNSGGALVNAKGELVGINSVLSSPTGAYAGYGFAIPTSIMTKVIADLKQYGTVQRALLGIRGGSIGSSLMDDRQPIDNSGKTLADKAKELGLYISGPPVPAYLAPHRPVCQHGQLLQAWNAHQHLGPCAGTLTQVQATGNGIHCGHATRRYAALGKIFRHDITRKTIPGNSGPNAPCLQYIHLRMFGNLRQYPGSGTAIFP